MQPFVVLAFLVSTLGLSRCDINHKRVRLVLPANLSVTCPSAALSSPRLTLWYHPNGTLVETKGRVQVGNDNGVLFIRDLANDDCGLYYCTSLASRNAPGSAAGLTFVEVYTVESKPYTERAIVGGVAALCVLTTMVFIALVFHFRYRTPKEKESGLPVVSRTNEGYAGTEVATSL
ncbi:unnamed protein product [Ixodes hexagonus]